MSKEAKGSEKSDESTDEEADQRREADDHGLPGNLDIQRTHVICGPELNYHVSTVTSALAYMSVGMDNSWHHESWAADFEMKVTHLDQSVLECELINIDPALVNALRRIIIAEVPTVAIEDVFVVDNTSVMAEEILAMRLGLVPLAIDPEALEWRKEGASERNTVVFKLHVQCKKGPNQEVTGGSVCSAHLRWLPGGSEYPAETKVRFGAAQPDSLSARPVDPDILLCRLVPRQSIELEAHAVVGIGADHAKFSPVGTAWYRLYPEVVMKKKPPREVIEALAAEVPEVFSVRQRKSGKLKLKIQDVRFHEDKIERIRHLSGEEPFKDFVEVRKRKTHFILTIESIGQIPPERILQRAIRILRSKSERVKGLL